MTGDSTIASATRTGFRAKSTLIVRVDGMPGSHITDMAEDMVALAKRLNACVACNINGCHIIASPFATVDDLQRQYDAQIAKPVHATAPVSA